MAVMNDLAGRVAVVTGAGQGIGYSIANRLEASGARIVALDLAPALESTPPSWQRQAIDLSLPQAQAELTEFASELKQTDIVVANAGLVPPWRSIDALDLVEWQRVMAVNVWGAAITLGAFTKNLAASSCGSAIFMASINGYKAHPRQVLYTASKHAVIGIMRAAAQDLGAQGIKVNAIAPGPIATQALRDRIARREAEGGMAAEDAWQALANETMLGRVASPEDVANVAHFLASDASAAMTGHVFPVEAGLL